MGEVKKTIVSEYSPEKRHLLLLSPESISTYHHCDRLQWQDGTQRWEEPTHVLGEVLCISSFILANQPFSDSSNSAEVQLGMPKIPCQFTVVCIHCQPSFSQSVN